MQIVDFHVHIGKSEKFDLYYTLEQYNNLMESTGIKHAVIMPNVSSEVPSHTANDDLLELEPAEDLFSVFLLVDPKDKSIITQIKENKSVVKGLKYHPSVHQEPVDSILLQPFIDKAIKNNIPILVHCGRDKLSNMTYLITAAKRNPKAKFIAAHMGGAAAELIYIAIERLAAENVKNIWLDSSAINLPSLIEFGVAKLGINRILFGSDVPYGDLRMSIACVDFTTLSKEEKEKVFYENSKQLISFGR